MSSSIISQSNQSSACIVIPAHNRKSYTLRCLAKLKVAGDLEQFSVIVVDDGSTDGTSQAIGCEYPQLTLLRGDGHLWWTGAIKLGMQAAIAQDCDFIIWLNDDCLVGENTIGELVAFASENAQSIVGAVGYESNTTARLSFGGKVRTYKEYRWLECLEQEIYPCDLLSGNLVCMPAEVVSRIGYPDCKITPHYGGDSLYLIRARKAGYSLFCDSRWPAKNISTYEQPSTNPSGWLTGDQPIFNIVKLIFNQFSLLSWRVWWTLYTEDYHYYGILLFFLKYLHLSILLAGISLLRVFPMSARRKISLFKRNIFLS